MIRSNYFTDNADLQQHVNELIDWNEVISTYENGFADAAEYQKTKNPRLEMAPSSNDEALAYYKEILQVRSPVCTPRRSRRPSTAKDCSSKTVSLPTRRR
jgi:hypothetical protein